MARGQIEQLDQPEEIYSNPRTVFAATFVGTSNRFNGRLESAAEGLCQAGEHLFHVPPQLHLHDDDAVLVMVRPEEITLQAAQEGGEVSSNGNSNVIAGVIDLRTFLGPFTRFHISTTDDAPMTADVPSQSARGYDKGQRVNLSFPPSACQVLALDDGQTKVTELAKVETA